MKSELRKKVRKYSPILEVLSKCTESQENSLFDNLTEYDLSFICESLYNSLHNLHNEFDLKTKEALRTGILKDKEKLRRLVKCKKNTKIQRKLLKQTGGSLGLILSAALPLITSLIRRR